MDDKFQKEYDRLKQLKLYQGAAEDVIRRDAFNNVLSDRIDVSSLFKDNEEKLAAKRLVTKYLDDFTPETVSDINTLRSIVYLEILDGRLQEDLNKNKDNKETVNLKTLQAIHENQTQILALKGSLGLGKIKKSEEESNVSKKIALMRKQFKVWLDNNQASRTGTCPYCKQVFLLKIRMEHWEMQKHPFFCDRVLGNKPLLELFFQGILTKDKIAEILECSPDYVEWIITKMKPEIQQNATNNI